MQAQFGLQSIRWVPGRYMYKFLACPRPDTQIRAYRYADSIRKSQYAKNHAEGFQNVENRPFNTLSNGSIRRSWSRPLPKKFNTHCKLVRYAQYASIVFLQTAAVSNDCIVFCTGFGCYRNGNDMASEGKQMTSQHPVEKALMYPATPDQL